MNEVMNKRIEQDMSVVDAAMLSHEYRQSALIEVLRVAQDTHGYLGADVMRHVARNLKLPLSRVYGVATFYHLFALAPPGKHVCDVCLGTACYVEGGRTLLNALERRLDTKAGATRADNYATLTTSRCIGSCGMAPLAVFDGVVDGPISSDRALEQVEGWLDGDVR